MEELDCHLEAACRAAEAGGVFVCAACEPSVAPYMLPKDANVFSLNGIS